MTANDAYRRWHRDPDALRWTCRGLPNWCVSSTFVPDRRRVYRRQYFAQYRGVTVGEASVSSQPEPVIDALDELLGREYQSPPYIWHQGSPETE